MSLISGAIGVGIGMALVFGIAYGLDAYRSWRYHFRQTRELRERPPIPQQIVRFEIRRSFDDLWSIYAYDETNDKIDWNTGEHPMDAIRYLVEQMERPA